MLKNEEGACLGQDVWSRETSMSKGRLEAKRDYLGEDGEPYLKQEDRVGVTGYTVRGK